jgi:hypothetical protein
VAEPVHAAAAASIADESERPSVALAPAVDESEAAVAQHVHVVTQHEPAQVPETYTPPPAAQHERGEVVETYTPSEPPRAARALPAAEPSHATSTIEAAAYRARPATQSFALPPDLVQIETAPDKSLPEPETPAGASEHQPRRPRRTPPEQVVNEPLVQIETRSEDGSS